MDGWMDAFTHITNHATTKIQNKELKLYKQTEAYDTYFPPPTRAGKYKTRQDKTRRYYHRGDNATKNTLQRYKVLIRSLARSLALEYTLGLCCVAAVGTHNPKINTNDSKTNEKWNGMECATIQCLLVLISIETVTLRDTNTNTI
jgi:hypothetical protein